MSKYDDLIGRARTHVGGCVIGEFSLFGVKEMSTAINFDIVSVSRGNYFPTKINFERYFFFSKNRNDIKTNGFQRKYFMSGGLYLR